MNKEQTKAQRECGNQNNKRFVLTLYPGMYGTSQIDVKDFIYYKNTSFNEFPLYSINTVYTVEVEKWLLKIRLQLYRENFSFTRLLFSFEKPYIT